MHDWDKLLRILPGYDPFKSAGDCVFDPDTAEKYISFIEECLTHVEGALAGKPFLLQDWQKSVVANLFGWKRPDSTRRYRELFLYVPRKNGKTPLAAAISLAVGFLDGEKGQQNYCAAADKDQAALLFRQAKGMIENESMLSSRCTIYGGLGHRSIEYEGGGGFMRVISADANTKHGGNPHLVTMDELHAQPNRELVDVLSTSMASKNRRQSIMINITTADFGRPSVCNEKYDYACKVRDGVIEDKNFLPVIFEAADKDDWKSPDTWKKANPNYGISVSEDYMERECKRAQEEPSFENTFKRLHLNIRTEQDVRWLAMDKWDLCGVEKFDAESLRGEVCYGGIDLASVSDIAALALFFPESKKALLYFWMPEETARIRERKARVPFATWGREGLIELTPGNRIDYQYIRNRLNTLNGMFNIRDIGYDPWNADQIMLQLREQDGFNMVEFRQGFNSMNQPCKHLEMLVMGNELKHGGNKLLRWMASNVTVKLDPAGNIKLDKEKSSEKIDGVVALVMSIGRSIANVEADFSYSEGLMVL